jgi:hypothetical protein
MSLVFNQVIAGPQTHILLIGVGAYRYLSGGQHERIQTDQALFDLGQLSSPMASVRAFHDMALSFHDTNSWVAPLGSIEVLISDSDHATEIIPHGQDARPTIANIRRSYREWKGRCHGHEDNVAIFLFCGHGIEKGDQFLLAEDFGEDTSNPWLGAFSFNSTRRAFHLCRAKTQCFFIDACRQVTPDMLGTGIIAHPLEVPDLLATDCAHDLTIRAAAANQGAYGAPDSPSFFTQALLNAFRGEAARSITTGEWHVDTNGIPVVLQGLLDELASGHGIRQRPIVVATGSSQLVTFLDEPHALLRITCDPLLALPHAELSYEDVKTQQMESRPPNALPWDVRVPSGIYRVAAQFSNNNYSDKVELVPVYPPKRIAKLICQ